MAKILITGTAGLLGSHFSRHMTSKGHTVFGVDNLSGGSPENLNPEETFLKREVAVVDELRDIFELAKPDFVYHLAAYAAVGLSPFIRRFNYVNNVVASANVVNCCVNYDVKKLVFASSMDVYGSSNFPPYTEDMRPDPEDPYGIAKYTVEMDLKQASRIFGLRYSIVRPHNIFGVRQNIFDKYRNVLGIWIRQTYSGKPMTVYGSGTQVRAFSDVKFYMTPLEALMDVGDGEIYNIGADKRMTINEAADIFRDSAASLGLKTSVVHTEPRDEIKEAYCDHTKAKRDLGLSDETDFYTLTREMLHWAREQRQHTMRDPDVEIQKRLYDFWK